METVQQCQREICHSYWHMGEPDGFCPPSKADQELLEKAHADKMRFQIMNCRTRDWKIVDEFEAETEAIAAVMAEVLIKLAHDSVPRYALRVLKETSDGWELLADFPARVS